MGVRGSSPTRWAEEASGYSVANTIGEMMAAGDGYLSTVEVEGYQLHSRCLDEGHPNVWSVYGPDGGQPIDAINLDNFRSAAEVEDYLKHEVPESA